MIFSHQIIIIIQKLSNWLRWSKKFDNSILRKSKKTLIRIKMQYSCVAFILLSPVVMLGFIAFVEIDYLNWKLIDEPEIGEPLIYHFIGPLSS